MMLPTHVVFGLAIATPLLLLQPDLAVFGLAGGLLGGIFPDLDLYWGHRRTFHFPTGYLILTVPATVVAIAVPTPLTVGVLLFVAGAAVHCQMDRLGGGLELEPWEETSDRGVYDHVRGRWREPKRLISYDGSPADFLLLAAVSVPLIIALDGPFRLVVILALVVGGLYAALRRRLAALAPTVFGYAPSWLEQYVPERYRHD